MALLFAGWSGSGGAARVVQSNRMKKYTDQRGATKADYRPLWGGFMAPPHRPVIEDRTDEVSAWFAVHGAGYEMGTWYTMIAGLLNILVIYDAYAGPLAVPISGKRKETEEDEDSGGKQDSATADQSS